MDTRSISADDAEAFSALRRKVVQDNPVPMGLTYEEELTRSLDSFRAQLSFTPPNVMFGSFADNDLIATAAVGYTSKFPSSRHKMLMWGVFTSPEYRRCGLSHHLVEKAIRHAFSNDVTRINLQVYVPNEPAIALYKSFGFEEYGMEPEAINIHGRYYDGIHMSLEIT